MIMLRWETVYGYQIVSNHWRSENHEFPELAEYYIWKHEAKTRYLKIKSLLFMCLYWDHAPTLPWIYIVFYWDDSLFDGYQVASNHSYGMGKIPKHFRR